MSVSASTASGYLSPLAAGQLRFAENVPLAFARSRPSPVRVRIKSRPKACGIATKHADRCVPKTLW
jgi:hypothetical protein